MKNKNITVLYIAGNGHSGSTLLDIIIGSSSDFFSAGELTFITEILYSKNTALANN
ncbi:hypothetical protein [Aequorivita ciconiae]|uniref:hypothetical protein n=1 Tax=Aequorivita ciconiae TaxID=2494375 RepID=UPI0013E32E96|nr:hypothetical protein [Aequorivita sp. H23M31]